jgi:hypothetical protein
MTFTSEVPYIAEFHTQPYTSLLYITFLEHNLHARMRGVESFEKLLREGKIKRKV